MNDHDDTTDEFETNRGSTLTDHGIKLGDDELVGLGDYRLGDHLEIVEETDDRVVFADTKGYELNEWANALGMDRSELSRAMREQAREVSDYSWSTSDPVVLAK